MKEISKEYAKNNNFKKIGVIHDTDMSKIIIKMQRLSENKEIKYYCMDFIIFDPAKHMGNIQVSFWADKDILNNKAGKI